MENNYKVRIDRQNLVVHKANISGRELLGLVDKTPEGYRLHQRLRGGRVEVVGPDEVVDLSCPGVERFMTLPLDQTEGDVSRREIRLPADDEEFLDAQGHDWETVVENRKQWLLIYSFPLPTGYTRERVTVALFIPPGYPDTGLDMAWFSPAVARSDGQAIKQTSASATISSQKFQRWSRHRTKDNPWRPSVDCVSTHLGLVSHWLEREFS